MALSLNGTSQWLDATRNATVVQPFTLMAWVRHDEAFDSKTIFCYGESDQEMSFNNIYFSFGQGTAPRGISFTPYAEAVGSAIDSTTTYHHLVAVFTGSNIILYQDGTAHSVSWSPSNVTFDLMSIGKTVSNSLTEYFAGYIEHAAAWNCALTASEVTALYNLSASPSDTESANLLCYLPLIDSLTDSKGTLSWTAHGLSSPSYDSGSGIRYSTTKSYTGNGAMSFGGSASTECNHKNYTGNGALSFGSDTKTMVYPGRHKYSISGRLPATATTTNANPATVTVGTVIGDTVLWVGIVVGGTTQRTGGNPTFNGVELTQAGSKRNAGGTPEEYVEQFYLLDPPIGNYTLSVPNSNTLNITIIAATAQAGSGYKSALDNGTAGASGSSTNPAASNTTAIFGEIIFAVVGNGATTWNPTARSGTQIYDWDAGSWGLGAQYILATDAGSYSTNWTFGTSEDWAISSASFYSVAYFAYTPVAILELSGSATCSKQTASNEFYYNGNGGIALSDSNTYSYNKNYSYSAQPSLSFGSSNNYNSGSSYSYNGIGSAILGCTATCSKISSRVINHNNYDPSSYSAAQIISAASLDVYFEHASTGQDIVGDSDGDSSTGNNNDSSDTCGLAKLYASNNRYLCSRESFDTSNDYTWFSSNNGLEDNNRGNPTPASKLSGFLSMSANMINAVDVVMFKFCWIDVWPEVDGYVSNGTTFAASMTSAISAFEASNPSVINVYWTMPVERDSSYQARQDFNDAIRTYCNNNNKWLIDIADIESHNPSGGSVLDGNGREVAYSTYVVADGGHLSSVGSVLLAKAYWSLIAGIASESNHHSYSANGAMSLNSNSEYSRSSNYNYSAVGGFALSSVDSYGYSIVYSYNGAGELLLAGQCSSNIQSGYSYSGNGSLLFNSSSSTNRSNNYSYSGSGGLNLGGDSLYNRSNNYSYSGNGDLILSSINIFNRQAIYGYIGYADAIFESYSSYEKNIPHYYSGNGAIIFGDSNSYNNGSNYSYSGDGSILLSTESIYDAFIQAIYIGTGSIELGSDITYGNEIVFNYIANANLDLSSAIISDYIKNYIYNGLLDIILGSSSTYAIPTGIGLWRIVITSVQPTIDFDSEEASMEFDSIDLAVLFDN